MSATFKTNRSDFSKANDAFKDMVQGHMAMDIEVGLKTDAGMPVKTGAMKSGTRHFKTDRGYRVEIDKEYAAYQEAGQRRDGSGRVVNYTTAGTSAGFFMRAINKVLNNRASYIAEAAKAVGL